MNDFDYHTDPRLGRNTAIVETDAHDGTWVLEHGINQDGEKGVTVTDMDAIDADDETITQLEYVFVYRTGVYVHVHTTLHRHGDDGHPDGGEGECEHVPGDDHPAPAVASDIIIDALGAPVASVNETPFGGTGTEECNEQ